MVFSGIAELRKQTGTPKGQWVSTYTSHHLPENVAFRRHIRFWDRRNKGYITPFDTIAGLMDLGYGVVFSVVLGAFFSATIAYATQDSWVPDPLCRVQVANLKGRTKTLRAKSVYNDLGELDPERFVRLYNKYAQWDGSGDCMSFSEAMLMAGEQGSFGFSPQAWARAMIEWMIIYFMVGRNGVFTKKAIHDVYNGTLFFYLRNDRQRAARAHLKTDRGNLKTFVPEMRRQSSDRESIHSESTVVAVAPFSHRDSSIHQAPMIPIVDISVPADNTGRIPLSGDFLGQRQSAEDAIKGYHPPTITGLRINYLDNDRKSSSVIPSSPQGFGTNYSCFVCTPEPVDEQHKSNDSIPETVLHTPASISTHSASYAKSPATTGIASNEVHLEMEHFSLSGVQHTDSDREDTAWSTHFVQEPASDAKLKPPTELMQVSISGLQLSNNDEHGQRDRSCCISQSGLPIVYSADAVPTEEQQAHVDLAQYQHAFQLSGLEADELQEHMLKNWLNTGSLTGVHSTSASCYEEPAESMPGDYIQPRGVPEEVDTPLMEGLISSSMPEINTNWTKTGNLSGAQQLEASAYEDVCDPKTPYDQIESSELYTEHDVILKKSKQHEPQEQNTAATTPHNVTTAANLPELIHAGRAAPHCSDKKKTLPPLPPIMNRPGDDIDGEQLDASSGSVPPRASPDLPRIQSPHNMITGSENWPIMADITTCKKNH